MRKLPGLIRGTSHSIDTTAVAGFLSSIVDLVVGSLLLLLQGTVKRGVISPNTPLLLGPDIGDGSFKNASIKSIHYKRLPVGQVVAGQTAALALKKIKRQQVRGEKAPRGGGVPEMLWPVECSVPTLIAEV